MVREFKASVAKREEVRLKAALAGPSGSGKSLSALLLAYGMVKDWSKIAFVDTENSSGLYYVGKEVDILKSDGTMGNFKVGEFLHVPFSPPYYPDDYIAVIDYITATHPNVELIILDSISHEWGACLDLQNKLGGKFQDWAKVSPLHEKFIDKVRLCPQHVIATMRSKQDYALETNDKGRAEVKKVGLKSEQRDTTEYEFGLVFNVDMQHKALASKDRTGLFPTVLPFQLTPAVGDKLARWCKGEL
jgi:hypothetical protein